MGVRNGIAGALTAASILVGGAAQLSAETLADALVSAYNNSNLLEQNRAVLRAADEDVATAVAALRPTLDYVAAVDFSRNFDASFVQQDDTVTNTLGISADLTLYEFGRNRLSIEAAKEAVLSTRQALIQVEQQVLFSAVVAYMDVIRAIEFVELRRNNVRVLTEEVRAANDRFEVGEVTRTDVAQAQSRQAEAQASLVAAEGDVETARESFNLAVGRYPGTLAAPPPLPRTADTLDSARTIALRGHPQILQAQRLVSVADLNVARAEAAILPRLSATADLGWTDGTGSASGDLEPTGTIGLELRGPIYRGGALNSAFRSTVAQRDQNRANLLQTTKVISENLGVAWYQVEVARAVLRSTVRQIDAARIAFEGVREEASLGARTTLDVLNAEQELLDAQGLRIDANRQEQVAIYGLLSAMGMLTADSLGLNVVAYDPEAYYNNVRTAPGVGSPQGIKLDRVLRNIGRN
ncbi:MAG: TolC family outer membrane protein [Rhodobacteraceae bacterium]|nr:TolC family outer membrane protein [Paracoccaceae bacterium]